jgi:anti-sigma factor RsiW
MMKKLKMMLAMIFGRFTCRDIEKLLLDYVEGDLDPDRRDKLAQHLADCPDCLSFVDTYRQTIAATHDHARPTESEMPPDLVAKLRSFIADNPDLG